MSNSSSSGRPSVQSSSTGSLSPEEAYLRQIQAPKPQTVGQIRAQGEVNTRLGVLWFVGVVCLALIILGGVTFIINPESAKDVWVVIGPIISSAVTGTVAFLTGEKQGSKK